jgi:hypothetical protein
LPRETPLQAQSKQPLVKIKLFAVVGTLLVIAGIAGLVHPQILLPAQKKELPEGDSKIIVETRRILRVPVLYGVIVILSGGALLFLSTKNPG